MTASTRFWRGSAQLKHIFHLNALAARTYQRKRCGLELWWAKGDFGVSRKTETFVGNRERRIEFAIGVFVMDQ